jgi:hypothetical protein
MGIDAKMLDARVDGGEVLVIAVVIIRTATRDRLTRSKEDVVDTLVVDARVKRTLIQVFTFRGTGTAAAINRRIYRMDALAVDT